MRVLALIALAVATVVPAATTAATPSTELRITLWARGNDSSPYRWTLRCGPPDGTLPNRTTACVRLNRLKDPFAPVPKDAACTEQYGGPARAIVTGRFKGRRIWTSFNRTDGCQIARWEKHKFLFGGVPLAAG